MIFVDKTKGFRIVFGYFVFFVWLWVTLSYVHSTFITYFVLFLCFLCLGFEKKVLSLHVIMAYCFYLDFLIL